MGSKIELDMTGDQLSVGGIEMTDRLNSDGEEVIDYEDPSSAANNDKDGQPKKRIISDAAIEPITARFDYQYILNTMYVHNKFLGGDIENEEKELRLLDPFNDKVNQIKVEFEAVKKQQNERNKQRENGVTMETNKLNNDIGDLQDRAEAMVKDLNDILRDQYVEFTHDEIDQKQEMFKDMEEFLIKLR